MPTNFPNSLDAYGAVPTNQQTAVAHRERHQDVEDAIEAIEAKVGVDGSNVTTSLEYRVRTLEGNPGGAGLDASLVSYTPPFTGSVTRTGEERLSDVVSVKDFGAVGDGVTDDSAAIQAAIEYVSTIGGGCVYLPKGRYRVPNNGTALRIKSSIAIYGDGMSLSVIEYDDSASASRRDCFRVFNDAGAYDISFRDLAIQSNWGTGDWAQRSHLTELHTTGEVYFTRCRFSDSRFFGTVIVGASRVSVDGCEYLRMYGDGCRPVGCNNVTVRGCYFKDVNDDSIAVHSLDTEASPVENSAVITGNRIVDSQGIACLGAKHVAITGNTITRAHTRAILVGDPGSSEGNTAVLSVSITGNVIDTVFDGSIFSGLSGSSNDYIRVEGPIPTATGGAYVGQPNGSGGILSPYPYLYTNNTDASAPAAGAWYVNITGNVCVRTLAPVAQYSDYGYGTRYARSGPSNPAVTAVNLGSTRAGIRIDHHGVGVNVAGNVIDGLGYGVWFNASPSAPYLAWNNCTVSNCVIRNFVSGGVYIQGTGTVRVSGCDINGDPLHVHPQRLANGKWTASFDDCPAIWADVAKAEVSACSFRNVGTVYRGTSANEAAWRANTLYCDPATGTGYNANNIGIGNLARAVQLGAQIVIEDGDPASATYGKQLNVCLLAASSIPTTGKYPSGYYVTNAAPSVAGGGGSQYSVIGWWRVTTGSGHVLNTDWREMRTLTGT